MVSPHLASAAIGLLLSMPVPVMGADDAMRMMTSATTPSSTTARAAGILRQRERALPILIDRVDSTGLIHIWASGIKDTLRITGEASWRDQIQSLAPGTKAILVLPSGYLERGRPEDPNDPFSAPVVGCIDVQGQTIGDQGEALPSPPLPMPRHP
jgi:hypothetical protein